MAEIGIIASIIGVAGAGFRLSLILNAASCEVANAGLEVHAISRGVSLFSMTLKQLGNVLQSGDSVHSQEALDAAKQVAEECNMVFGEIELMLEKVRSRRPDGTLSLHHKFKWAFKKGRVTYLLGQLESLKLNLSLMLQILQLGKLMASTSKSDAQEEVAVKINEIQQERIETQNIIIVRYWQIQEVDQLYEEAQREAAGERLAEIEPHGQAVIVDGQPNQSLLTNGTPQLAIEPAPEYESSNAITRLPLHSLGELDQVLYRIRQSPREMMQVSNDIIDPLLEHWTRWHEVRERRHARDSGGSARFTPSVQNLYEEDEEKPVHQTFQEREDSPRGYYLEGNTTDWRKPNSGAARTEASKLRKRYSGYQPSVSADSSEIDDSPGSKDSKKRSPRHHVIDSNSESSDSDPPPRRHRRKSSGSPTSEKKLRFPEGTPLAHSHSAGQQLPGSRLTTSPGTTPYTTPRGSLSHPYPPMPPRPLVTPTQNPQHHSVSSPLPPISTNNAPNQYTHNNTSPYSPNMQQPPLAYGNLGGQAFPRYVPPQDSRIPIPPRPGSQDGKTRSPSRLSSQYGSYGSSYGSSRAPGSKNEYEKRASREKTKKNLREGATKGILGAGAMAGFLDMLEGFAI